ncbi:GAF domain-containing protein [Lancefieldella rimae]|uniref:GAF domain-containing protein n=1 Tax=Lancefieldella rimae TaxID=1383 RepID=UPI003C6F7838
MPDYTLLAQQIEELAEIDAHWLPVLANTAALLWGALEDINWAGFYLVDSDTGSDGVSELRLGPFQGNVACVRIPFGKGVCGTAAETEKSQLVEDVHKFPGHIACDAASNSEVVVPLKVKGSVVGVLDIDSPTRGRFSEEDLFGLEAVARKIEQVVEFERFV